MVFHGAIWPWVCHTFPPWVLWPLCSPLDQRLLVVYGVVPVNPEPDHGEKMMYFTGDSSRVAQYHTLHANSVPISQAVITR